MSKRKFYRNFNKRKKFNATKSITIMLCICIIGSYAYINLKDKGLWDKLESVSVMSSIKNLSAWDGLKKLFNKSDVITSSDISSELGDLEENKDSEENAKVASVNEMEIYTIQVASIENKNDLKKVEDVMEEYKFPSANMDLDNTKKVQVYASLKEDKVRENLEDTRTYFSDAFLTKIEIPMLSLQYTDSYSYMEDIAKGLNNLIENYKKESEYWDLGEKNLETYNEILTSRNTILDNLKKNTNKINYSKMDKFKENLISYIDEVEEKILISSKSANENKNYISQGALLSSIQGYYLFVNSMK
ncbi:hypothetical protein H9L25_04125 [Terrisporobacter mayombei]|nr:hypothetical protein [Terrisporobacter mayombei]